MLQRDESVCVCVCVCVYQVLFSFLGGLMQKRVSMEYGVSPCDGLHYLRSYSYMYITAYHHWLLGSFWVWCIPLILSVLRSLHVASSKDACMVTKLLPFQDGYLMDLAYPLGQDGCGW